MPAPQARARLAQGRDACFGQSTLLLRGGRRAWRALRQRCRPNPHLLAPTAGASPAKSSFAKPGMRPLQRLSAVAKKREALRAPASSSTAMAKAAPAPKAGRGRAAAAPREAMPGACRRGVDPAKLSAKLAKGARSGRAKPRPGGSGRLASPTRRSFVSEKAEGMKPEASMH